MINKLNAINYVKQMLTKICIVIHVPMCKDDTYYDAYLTAPDISAIFFQCLLVYISPFVGRQMDDFPHRLGHYKRRHLKVIRNRLLVQFTIIDFVSSILRITQNILRGGLWTGP